MPLKIAPPVIDNAKCTRCGLCVRICPTFVLKADPGAVPTVVNPNWCIACDHCGAACPAGAISFQGRPLREPDQAAVEPRQLQELLRMRRSVRLYRPDPVDRETILEVLEAGRHCPTGSNRQNVRYLVFTDRSELEELRRRVIDFYARLFRRVRTPLGALSIRLAAGSKTLQILRGYLPLVELIRQRYEAGEDRLFFHAPVVILAHAESWDTCSAFNCAAALFACSLKAHTMGLGTCFNGFLEEAVVHDRSLKKWLGVPRDHRVYGAMTMGRSAVEFKRWVYRKPPEVTWR